MFYLVKMLKKNKQGSHVGMILSFVMFITFTLFIYTLISPNINTSESKRALLNEISLKLIRNMSANFTSFSININSNPSASCVSLEGILLYAEISPNVIVKDESQNKQTVYYHPRDDGNNLRISRINNSKRFFKIYSSAEFPKLAETSMSCQEVPFENGYVIGSWNAGSYIFENNIYYLVGQYNEDYEKVKSGLGISPGNEFSFEFILSNGTRVGVEGDIPTMNIYAEDVPVQYIDDNANTLSGFINIKVW